MIKKYEVAVKEAFDKLQKKYEELGYVLENKDLSGYYATNIDDKFRYEDDLISLINENSTERIIICNRGNYGYKGEPDYIRIAVYKHDLTKKSFYNRCYFIEDGYGRSDLEFIEDIKLYNVTYGIMSKVCVTLDKNEAIHAEEVRRERRKARSTSEEDLKPVSNPAKIAAILKKGYGTYGSYGYKYVTKNHIIGIRKTKPGKWGRGYLYEVAHLNSSKKKIIYTQVGSLITKKAIHKAAESLNINALINF